MSAREAAIERGRIAYNTRYRMLQAVRRHLIGMGIMGVDYVGRGYDRNITIPGYNVHVRRNVLQRFQKDGRRVVLDGMKGDDTRPLVIFEVPTYAEEPEDILAIMPIDTFIDLLRRNQ